MLIVISTFALDFIHSDRSIFKIVDLDEAWAFLNAVSYTHLKYVVPDMAQSFGTLEFAGESEPIFERDKNNRRVLARRSYNLYSDVQKGENVVVEIPVQAGEKKFKYEQKVKLVNPKLYGRGYAIGNMGHTDYVLVADDIVAVEEK